ncbi:type 2 lanthipeptide synthetase LanM family protein [Pontibacillus salicampi]|uniref:Type 2 lanthipeptide synthetase LanM family protein n=1 Tax=Pontibacillus salicampi TaxID=1449801 RepID=A0ABV6LMJ4_9BACI
MNGLTDILWSFEKQTSHTANDKETLLDRNIHILYKGKIELVEESLSNILSIQSMDHLRNLYQTEVHNSFSKMNVFLQMVDLIADQEVNPEVRQDQIMFHSYALKVSGYMIDTLQQNTMYQSTKHNLKDEEAFLQDISNQFQQQVLRISYRTLVLDLNKNQQEALLKGKTEEEQYTYYNYELLEDPSYIREFFHLYPTLLRIIANEIRKYHNHITEMLSRYEQDKEEIANTILTLPTPERIESIEIGLGDAHADGRKVAKLQLETSTLIYKPRSLDVDLFYTMLTDYINNKVGESSYHLQTPEVVNRDGYGWVQYIPYKECDTEQDVEWFYRRMGGQLALLYALNAVDFHSENIIAHGRSPILIDLESLFHVPHSQVRVDQENAHVKAFEQLTKSVRAIGLLPFFFGEHNTDVSGIGHKGKSQSIIKVPQIKNPKSSQMKVERDFVDMEATSNQPKLHGDYIQAQDYMDDLKKGFRKVYQTIMENQAEVQQLIHSKKDGIVVRFIPKPTVQYSSFLELSFHPRFLHNSIDREVYLARIWEDAKTNDRFIPLAKHEYEDLINNDVPYFKLYIDSHDLLNARGEVITDYFPHSPLDLVQERIQGFSQEDMNFQLEIIDLSMLATADERKQELNQFTPKDPTEYTSPFQSEAFLIEQAEELAEYLYTKAFVGENNNRANYSWLNTSTVGVEEIQWRLSPMGDTLYDGLSGMAMTYLSLWLVTGNIYYLGIASDITEDIITRFQDLDIQDETKQTMSIGAFSGLSSIVYLLMNMDAVLEETKYRQLAIDITKKIPHFLNQDKEYDIVSGSAGAIVVLINCYKQYGDPIFFDIATKCANHIMDHAITINEEEVAWTGIADQPLTGFSHGSAGIIYALSMLNDIQGSNRLSEYITKGRHYENRQMIASRWMDQRNLEQETAASAWCHGSPGILLSRLGLMDSREESIANAAKEDAEIALHNMYQDGFGREHSLCHGDIGNAAILISYGRKTNQPDVENFGKNLMLESFQGAKQNGFRCGVGRGVETPNFMVGLAGMAYGALYAANEQIPNILCLSIHGVDVAQKDAYHEFS